MIRQSHQNGQFSFLFFRTVLLKAHELIKKSTVFTNLVLFLTSNPTILTIHQSDTKIDDDRFQLTSEMVHRLFF
jgi:hypothetical protein